MKRCKKSKSQGDKLFWDAKLAVLQQCQGRSLLKALRWTTDWHWFSLQCADRFPAFWSKQGGWMMDDVEMLGCWDGNVYHRWLALSIKCKPSCSHFLVNQFLSQHVDRFWASNPTKSATTGWFWTLPKPEAYHLSHSRTREVGGWSWNVFASLGGAGRVFPFPQKRKEPLKDEDLIMMFPSFMGEFGQVLSSLSNWESCSLSIFWRPCMRSPLPLKCYPIALRRSVRQGEYVESSLTLDMLFGQMFQGPTFMEDIQIWSVPKAVLAEMQQVNAAWLVSDVSRNRMHEGELQWSALAVDLPKMMNLHEQKIQKVARNLTPVTSAWGHGISYRNMDLERFAWDQQTWIVPWRKCLCFGGGRPGAALFEDVWS